MKWCETSCVWSSALAWGDMTLDGPPNSYVTTTSHGLPPCWLCSSLTSTRHASRASESADKKQETAWMEKHHGQCLINMMHVLLIIWCECRGRGMSRDGDNPSADLVGAGFQAYSLNTLEAANGRALDDTVAATSRKYTRSVHLQRFPLLLLTAPRRLPVHFVESTKRCDVRS